MADTSKIAATATYRDTWAGDVPVSLVAARSTRRGERVTIYRWAAEHGGINAGGMVPTVHPQKAIRFAQNHPYFSNVVTL